MVWDDDDGREYIVVSADAPQGPDAALIDALLAFVNQPAVGKEAKEHVVVICQGGSDLTADWRCDRAARRRSVQLALTDRRKAMQAFLDCKVPPNDLVPVIRVGHRLEPNKTGRGLSLRLHRYFRTSKEALDFAEMLLLDSGRSFGENLSRCRLPSCGKFFLARQNRKGGPPNRKFCCADHRREAHDRKLIKGKK
jgi:hypothetical protein